MSDEQDKLKLSLEAPKLFGRKKKPAPAPTSSEPAQPPSPAARKPASRKPATPKPAEEPETAEPPVEDTPLEPEVVEDTPVKPEVVEDTPVEPEAVEAAVEDPVDEPEVDEEPTVVLGAPEDAAPSEPEPVEEPTAVLDAVEEPEPVVEHEPEPTAKTSAKPAPEPAPKPASKPAARATAKPAPRPVKVEPAPVTDTDLEDAEIAALASRGPLLTAYRAAAISGLVVGAAMVVLTFLSLRGCEAVRGTSSCGGGPGFILLIATFALCVLLGSALLKAFLIPDPGSSSFLAVGLVAVVALLFLIDFLDSWSMLVIIPILSIGAYLASVWVTKTFVEPVDT